MIELYIKNPETGETLYPETLLKLNRFDNITWILKYGWYPFDPNHLTCGWYLMNKDDHKIIRPLQMNDFDDIYLIGK